MSILKSTFIVTVFTLLGRLFGFFREMVLGYLFGASSVMDAYLLAYIVPTTIGGVIEASTLNVFLPSFLKTQSESEKAHSLISSVVAVILSFSVLIGCLVYFYATSIVEVIAPGFSRDKAELAVSVLKILSPMIFFYGLYGCISAFLQTNKRFALISFAALPFNLSIIIISFLSYQKFDVLGLAVGTALGVVAQSIWVLLGVRGLNIRFGKLNLKFVVLFVKKSTLVAFTSIIVALPMFIDRFISSELLDGDLASLNYGNRVCILFTAIIINSVITVLFPELSLTKEDKLNFEKLLTQTMRVLIIILLPVILIGALYGQQIIQLLFYRGAFTLKSIQISAYCFQGYILGLLGTALIALMQKVSYALEDFKTPCIVSLIIAVLHYMLGSYFSAQVGIVGLSWSYSVSMTLVAAGYVVLNYYRCFNHANFLGSFIAMLLFSAFYFTVLYGVSLILQFHVSSLFCDLVVKSFIIFMVYFTLLVLCKNPELYFVLNLLRKRLH